MSLLALGLSHRTASVSFLERTALDADRLASLLEDGVAAGAAAEIVVLATCSRLELYAEVDKFHAGVDELAAQLAQHTGLSLDELTPHLYVHYEDRAVHHLFSVACGLDSMVVGESQILRQIKDALALSQKHGTAGRNLNNLVQQALRVGKRAHTETNIDRAGQSLVTLGLGQVEQVLGPVSGRAALVVGAGSMSSLAAMTLRRADIGELTVVNRTFGRATHLAEAAGGRAYPSERLSEAIAEADLIISCTGAAGFAIGADVVAEALTGRSPHRPLVLLDLAMPRDVDPAVRELSGVTVVDLVRLAEVSAAANAAVDVEAVRAIVAEEVAAFRAAQHALRMAPTIVALRSMAARVAEAELTRLSGRLPDLEARDRAEIALAVRRVVDKLLHAPTVRIKQLAREGDGLSYARALGELFDLDPKTVEAVSLADPAVQGEPITRIDGSDEGKR
ncbi:MAG: glutamyl-tRNA reductase [Pseudonocardiales bacterium]|jgi:glutamyl-tRNA reductase|nr:glutamyl-tRNA reductase [Pseudonocardiales bacterium]